MRIRGNSSTLGVFGLVVAYLTVGTLARGGEPRLNQLQVIGSHNSYHVAPDGAIRELLVSRNGNGRKHSTTRIARWQSNSRR